MADADNPTTEELIDQAPQTPEAPTPPAPETAETPRAADDKGEKGPQAIPYERFKEVNDLARQYRELGSPEEIRELQRQAREYATLRDRATARQREEEARTRAQDRDVQTGEQILDLLDKAKPGTKAWLEKREAWEQEQQAAQQRARDEIDARASTVLRDQLREWAPLAPLAEDAQSFGRVCQAVDRIIQSDEKLAQEFERPQTMASAVGKAFDVYRGDVNRVLLATGAQEMSRAAARRAQVPSRATHAPVGPAFQADDTIKAQPGTQAWAREARSLEDRLIEEAWKHADAQDAAG